MNFGFNSNVSVGSATYHVQTEDRGASHPFFDTVVYLAGRVVYKRSTGYERLARGAKAEVLAEKLHELLARQHRAVIAQLEAGRLPLHTTVKENLAADNEVSPDGLELRLLNPKGCFVAGKFLLEIALFDKHSKQQVGEANIQAFLEKKKQRVPCAEARTDAKGRARLEFLFPANASEGASLVILATHGARSGELRFRLKAKPRDKAPAPTLR
jgi:hypothetical protein